MEGPGHTTAEKEKNKLVIPVGKVNAAAGSGGGGIVVGLIFLGGVMGTVAFTFLFRRQRRKPGNGENRSHNREPKSSTDEVPCKFMEDKNTHDDKDFNLDAVNSSSRKDIDQNLRNGSSQTGVGENDAMISEEGFFRGENDSLEVQGRYEESLSNGEDVIHSNSPKVLTSSMQYDPCATKEKEFPLPIVENKMLLQPKIVENAFSKHDAAKIKEENDNGTAIVDQDMKEGHQKMLVNPEGEQMDASSWKEEDMGALHCPESTDITNGGQEDRGNGSHTILMFAKVEETWMQYESSLTIRAMEVIQRETAELADDHASIGNHQKLQQVDELRTSPNRRDQEEEDNHAPHELTSEGSPTLNSAENVTENGFKEVQQPAESIQGPKEKLQLPKEEQFVKKQSLVYHNKVAIDGSLKLSLLGRYILQLAELTHQTRNTHKRRILVFTVLALSGSLRVWYFSRPFLRILLMHLRNYLMIKLHLRIRKYLKSYGRIRIVPKMLGI